MASQYIDLPFLGSGVTSLNGLTGALTLLAGTGITITPGAGTLTIAATGTGTVTSVGLALPVSVFTVSGSPVTTTGTLTGSFASQSANLVFASPNGAPGVPTFRALVAGDLPGGTGTVTSVGMTVPTFLSVAGSPITTSGTLAVTLSGAALPVANGGTGQTSLGNLTDAGTDGIVVTGGTGAVITSVSLAQHVADSTHNGYLSQTDWSTFNGKQASGNYITALTGDGTAAGPGSVALTLATVNGNVGTFGSSTSIPTFTVNAKGLITAASGNVVIAPAGTLTGTTLNATVVTSSLTSVGTIATGVWNGTVIGSLYGGTGGNSSASTGIAHVSSGTWSYSTIVNADISASAAIDFSKLATLTSANILVGNGSNVAASVAVSGDISLTNAGVTALVATSNGTLTQLSKSTGVAVHGTNTNDSASAGYVGEFISANPGGAVTPAATNVGKNITSISLTAGDWDVEGFGVLATSTIVGTRYLFGVSTLTDDFDSASLGGIVNVYQTIATSASYTVPTGARRISVASTTTVYLVGLLTYTALNTATYSTSSFIRARRVR